MKNNRFLLALALLLTAPALKAQVQPLPNDVTFLTFEDCKAVIISDTVSGLEDGIMNAGAGVSIQDQTMKFYGNRNIRLHLSADKVKHFYVRGNAEVTFQGTFHYPIDFKLKVEDLATVTFEGISDTLSAKMMSFTLKDEARVNVKSRIVAEAYDFSAKDNSRMKAFIVELGYSENQEQLCHVYQSEHASINIK